MGFVRSVGLVPLFLLAACGPRPTTDVERGRPVILTDSLFVGQAADTLRFGRMHAGEIAVQELLLINRTGSPTAVVSYDRSCGCVGVEFDSRPLAPDRTQRVTVSFDSRGERGWQFKTLDLRFAGCERPLRFFIEAEVE